MSDFNCTNNRIRLAEKALDQLAIFENSVADSERRRYSGNQSTELVFRYRPNLYFDTRTCEGFIPKQTRFGRLAILQA